MGIANGRIEAIGALSHAEAARRIDATGHVVAPGFIDMHSHSDITLLDDPGGESKAHQGVTTEVTGNCSYTPWPAGKGGPEALQKNLGRTLIGNVKWEWHTLDDWAGALESNGISINVAPQLGHSGLQIASGAVEDRPATPDELREMKRLAAEAMEMGAFSLSTGLSVAPSAYGTTDDIVELCASIRHYEGPSTPPTQGSATASTCPPSTRPSRSDSGPIFPCSSLTSPSPTGASTGRARR